MRLTISDDFDPLKIAQSGQCFRAVPAADGALRFIAGASVLYIRNCGGNTYDLSCSPDEWKTFWAGYFDMDRSYRTIREGIPAGDRFMREAAESGKGIRILRQDPWETLVSFIISQRKSIPAIRRAIEALCAAFGKPTADGLYAFPSAERLASAAEAELGACGLGYRLPYVSDAARRAADGRLDLAAMDQLDDQPLTAALMEVYGVGIKVASCVTLFAYGRTASAPIDTWMQKIIGREYGGVNPFPAYGKNAGILQQYAFYHAQMHKDRYR